MSESVTLIIEMDEEGNPRSMQTLNTYTAKDGSYSTSDLKPRFLDLSDIRKKLGVDAESREDRQEVLQELAEELWGRFREMAYTDLVSLAEKAQERADEIRHRIHAEDEAVDTGKLSSEDCLFRGDHHHYAGFLNFQASLARQAVQAVEELGRPLPAWDDLSESEKEAVGPDPVEGYNPSPHCKKILCTVAQIGDEQPEVINQAESKSDVFRFVKQRLEWDTDRDLNSTLRSDMKDRGKAPSVYPESPSELADLADRWTTLSQRSPEKPER